MKKKQMVKVVKATMKMHSIKLHNGLYQLLNVLEPEAKKKISTALWAEECVTSSVLIGPFFKNIFNVEL